MKKYLGLIISLIGIAILAFSIYTTAKTEGESGLFLQPIGILLAIGGSLGHIFMNQKKKS